MKKPNRAAIELSLSVQYAIPAPELPRWRLRRWVKKTLASARDHLADPPQQLLLTIRIVDEAEGRSLNLQYRKRDYATNVLTFDYDNAPAQDNVWIADIVLCSPVLHREALEQHKTLLDHAAHLCVHATLHALGFDHLIENEATEMENLETCILSEMGIADPYQIPDTSVS